MRNINLKFILLFITFCVIGVWSGSTNLQTIENLSTYATVTANSSDVSVAYGAKNVDITISAQAYFSGIGDNQDQCSVSIEFYHPGMDPCTQTRTSYLRTGGSVTAFRTCTIPGPLYYTESASVAATATSSRGAYASNTKSFKIIVGSKPPGPTPNPDSNPPNWGLILGISIPGAIVFIALVCYCCKKNKKENNAQRQKLLGKR